MKRTGCRTQLPNAQSRPPTLSKHSGGSKSICFILLTEKTTFAYCNIVSRADHAIVGLKRPID